MRQNRYGTPKTHGPLKKRRKPGPDRLHVYRREGQLLLEVWGWSFLRLDPQNCGSPLGFPLKRPKKKTLYQLKEENNKNQKEVYQDKLERSMESPAASAASLRPPPRHSRRRRRSRPVAGCTPAFTRNRSTFAGRLGRP